MQDARHDFPSFLEGLSLRRFWCGHQSQRADAHFPSFSKGLSLRRDRAQAQRSRRREGVSLPLLEGLSLRPIRREQREQREGILRFQAETFIEASPWLLKPAPSPRFLRFLAETFIEASQSQYTGTRTAGFPFLFGGAFIEAKANNERFSTQRFPYSFVGTFIEAGVWKRARLTPLAISLPFRRDLH